MKVCSDRGKKKGFKILAPGGIKVLKELEMSRKQTTSIRF